jgi:hypothetical protein
LFVFLIQIECSKSNRKSCNNKRSTKPHLFKLTAVIKEKRH